METCTTWQRCAAPRTPCNLQMLRLCNPLLHTKNSRKPPRYSSCKATGSRVDRRDVLLGIGGAAAAGLATSYRDGALAKPIQPPDLQNCDRIKKTGCCPPYHPGTKPIEFRLPSDSSPLRVRQAAHLVVNNKEYMDKYECAVARMKALPDDDPRSFAQQWRVHCAYCTGAYEQAGCPSWELQIHCCWLFLPWHRLYLYFHERILGKLIGDDAFALPFWNWDAPEGMYLPQIYTKRQSPLYDPKRNPEHQPPSLVDLSFKSTTDPTAISRDEHENLIKRNLKTMYRQMISGAKKRELFFGLPYCQGDRPNPGAGTIEFTPHNTVHNWTGDPRPPNCGQDMGLLCSAARDPLFFAHHGNVDRMWNIWKDCLGNTDITDPDWLDAKFLFYDEDAQLVSVRVRDALDTTALRYTYQDLPLPWRNAKPLKAVGEMAPPTTAQLPSTLEQTVRVKVTRPRNSRSRREKDEEEEVLVVEGEKDDEEEVLVVEGVEIADHSRYVKFDVLVNGSGDESAAAAQFAGSVVLLPHSAPADGGSTTTSSVSTAAWFGITDLMEEIGADGDSSIVVSLVPRAAGEMVTVGNVKIIYVK